MSWTSSSFVVTDALIGRDGKIRGAAGGGMGGSGRGGGKVRPFEVVLVDEARTCTADCDDNVGGVV